MRRRRPHRPGAASAGGRSRCPTARCASGRRSRRGGVSGRRLARARAGAGRADRPGARARAPRRDRVAAAGDAYIWTAKQAASACAARVVLDGERHELDGDAAFIDDSAGYHARHTAWKWSAGVGRLDDGRRGRLEPRDRRPRLAARAASGRCGSTASRARSGPSEFAADLSRRVAAALRFSEWSAREENRQPARDALALPPAVRHVRGGAARRPRAGRGLRRDGGATTCW